MIEMTSSYSNISVFGYLVFSLTMTATAVFQLCLVLCLLQKVYLVDLSVNKNLNQYGPYDISWGRYETCKGPKMNNATVYQMHLFKEGDIYYAWMNITFLTQVHLDELKINVYVVKNKNTSLLLNYKVNNPCQHYAIAVVIETALNAKNCIVKQGVFNNLVNFTDVSYKFFGKSFFYGEYILKVTVTSKKGNILCFTLNQIFDKKKNQ